jgi:hypothetical protein
VWNARPDGFFHGGTFGDIFASPFALRPSPASPSTRSCRSVLFGAGIGGIMVTSTLNGRVVAPLDALLQGAAHRPL